MAAISFLRPTRREKSIEEMERMLRLQEEIKREAKLEEALTGAALGGAGALAESMTPEAKMRRRMSELINKRLLASLGGGAETAAAAGAAPSLGGLAMPELGATRREGPSLGLGQLGLDRPTAGAPATTPLAPAGGPASGVSLLSLLPGAVGAVAPALSAAGVRAPNLAGVDLGELVAPGLGFSTSEAIFAALMASDPLMASDR